MKIHKKNEKEFSNHTFPGNELQLSKQSLKGIFNLDKEQGGEWLTSHNSYVWATLIDTEWNFNSQWHLSASTQEPQSLHLPQFLGVGHILWEHWWTLWACKQHTTAMHLIHSTKLPSSHYRVPDDAMLVAKCCAYNVVYTTPSEWCGPRAYHSQCEGPQHPLC